MTAIPAALLAPLIAWSTPIVGLGDDRVSAPAAAEGPAARIGSAPAVAISRAADALGVPVALDAPPVPTARVRSTRIVARAGHLRLTSGFGMRYHPLLGRPRFHEGIDIAGQANAPIFSAGAGVVTQARWSGGYGLLVTVLYHGGLQSRYGHLSGMAVRPGQTVSRGQLIGFVGTTGRTTGPHLHYELRLNGVALDPLGAVPR